MPKAVPRPDAKYLAIRVIDTVDKAAAPSPWTNRTSNSNLGSRTKNNSDPKIKIPMPANNVIFMPRRSAMNPAAGLASSSAKSYTAISKPIVKAPTPTTCAYAGRLVATICAPKEVTKPLSARIIKYQYRNGRCALFPIEFEFMSMTLMRGSCGAGRVHLRRQIDAVRRLNAGYMVAME